MDAELSSGRRSFLQGNGGFEYVVSLVRCGQFVGALRVLDDEQRRVLVNEYPFLAWELYKLVEFEQQCPCYVQNNKQLLSFDESFERLKLAGYERHARPQEVFGLLIEGLEGRLNGELLEVSADMIASYGEWLSLAFERKGDVLVCYIDPTGLVWNGSSYEKQNFSHAGETTFDIRGVSSGQWVGLEKFRPDFVQFLYGRRFDQLPAEMREGNKKAHAYLPSGGVAWPVARVGFNGRCNVDGYSYVSRASRGVRQSQKKNSMRNEG